MKLVTLTTDYGTKDYYVAFLKGRIYSQATSVQVVDLCNHIEPYNISKAAFVVKNSFHAFPMGTIHLICVSNFYNEKPRFLAFEFSGHFFVVPDNGILSLMFDSYQGELYELIVDESLSLPDLYNFYANAASYILENNRLDGIGNKTKEFEKRYSIQPIIGKDYIRGTIVHVDVFENVIVNVDREIFERVSKGRNFELYFKRFDPLTLLSEKYSDVQPGDPICLFNSGGLLEIAVHNGKAASLFGLDLGDTVQIDFHYDAG